MRRTVLALFRSMEQAQKALEMIEDARLANNDISMVVRESPAPQQFAEEYAQEITGWAAQEILMDRDSLTMPFPALDIPNIGPVGVSGPVGELLAEDPDRTLANALTFYGVTNRRGEELEKQVGKGQVLVVIETNSAKANKVSNVLADLGGRDIEKWSKGQDKPIRPWNQGN